MTEKELKTHRIYLEIARQIARFSKCRSHQVGAVIVKDGRIISTGYNGTPTGFPNCEDVFPAEFDREEHHRFSDSFEIHAEMNAILFAAKNIVQTDGADMYCTLRPCNQCLKNICNSGIRRVFYMNEYDRTNFEIQEKLLSRTGMQIIRISPEGTSEADKSPQ